MCAHLSFQSEFGARRNWRSRRHASSLQTQDEERGAQGQPDNRKVAWKPRCIVRSPVRDRIRVNRPVRDEGNSTWKPGRATAFSSCSFVSATSKVNSLSDSSPTATSAGWALLCSSLQTMDADCSGDNRATTWSHIFVRYLSASVDEK